METAGLGEFEHLAVDAVVPKRASLGGLSFCNMGKNRDNFTQKVRDALARRVGYICSNPICEVFTEGSSGESSLKVFSIGKAAHICAAAPGGPRFNPKMTKDERSAIENGIWLCSICADLKDRDTTKYRVGLFLDW